VKAMLQDVYGPPEVLHLGEVAEPALEASDVLIQVRAAGVDRGTAHLMRGEPYLMRVIGFGFRRPKNPVLGHDVAGTVAQVGSDVTEFQVSDDVFGIAKGSFAEYVPARTSSFGSRQVSPSRKRRLFLCPRPPPCRACVMSVA
jgi:NADPH:quinone reductase-like Zn-dependent oxidoreductase